MKIEHIAIWVKDLEAQANFWETYFEGKREDLYVNPDKGFSSYFIRFQNGTRLELMKLDRIDSRASEEEGLGYAHIAVSVGTRQKVRSLTEQLETDGYKVVSYPRVTGDGYFESCILDAEGNRIEITG